MFQKENSAQLIAALTVAPPKASIFAV